MVDAGKFDGALGIVSAISAVKALKVNGKLDKLRRPVEVSIFFILEIFMFNYSICKMLDRQLYSVMFSTWMVFLNSCF